MSTPTVPAAALALLLAAAPTAAQALPEEVVDPGAAPAVGAVVQETEEAPSVDDAQAGAQEDVTGTAPTGSDVMTENTPLGEDALEGSPTETEGAEEAEAAAEADPAAGVELEDALPANDDPALAGVENETSAQDATMDCSTCDLSLTAGQVPVTDGYQNDGYDRPFWWESDGLHFSEPIPANGYVNINVPGAQNLSIDTHRELIGATFIPWSYFGLEPGMCITWTESNGYNYHFGEDNSGRDGVNENGWQYCVPGDPVDPVDPVDPIDPTPVDPVDPVSPVTPAEPVLPTPVEPTVPSLPAVPAVPAVPAATVSRDTVTTPATTPITVATPQETSTPAPASVLAWTGADATTLALVAAGAAALGTMIWGVARRRQAR